MKNDLNVPYRLLVVDDEPIIADGLELLLQKTSDLNLTVYKSYTVANAMDIFNRERPQIVLTDIKMPTMTGLDMVAKMRAENPDLKVLYLTGYDQFDFAYSAIKQGAQDYILKAEGDDVVLAAIRRTIREIRKEKELAKEYDQAQRRMTLLLPSLQQQFFHDIIVGTIPGDQFVKIAKELEVQVNLSQKVLLVAGRDLQENLSARQRQIILATVEHIFQDYLNESVRSVFSTFHIQDYVWFLVTDDIKVVETVTALLSDAQNILYKNLQTPLSFAVASSLEDWKDLSKKYRSLTQILWQYTLDGQCNIIQENNHLRECMAQDDQQVAKDSFVMERYQILQTYLEKGQFDLLSGDFEEICHQLRTASRHSMHALELYFSTASVLISYIERNGLQRFIASQIQLADLFDPGLFNSWSEAADYLRHLVDVLRKTKEISDQNQMELTIARIKQYIMKHLSEDLSLSSLGRAFGFNASYLSRIFKQCEGKGIHDYIVNCRMELASNLLRKSSLKIHEISRKCGYSNIAYFTKAFHASYGKTPQEFRILDPQTTDNASRKLL